MKNAKGYRQQAWSALSGNWGIAILASLIVGVALAVIGTTGIGMLLVEGPLYFGFYVILTDVLYKREAKVESILDGFKYSFVNSFVTQLLVNVFTFLWSLLFVIPGIIKSYSYAMSIYIQKDNPQMSSTQCIDASKNMMNGHKWKLFCLKLSFIGWYLLSALTCGILLLWVIPYVQTATTAFYEDLKAIQNQQAQPEQVA